MTNIEYITGEVYQHISYEFTEYDITNFLMYQRHNVQICIFTQDSESSFFFLGSKRLYKIFELMFFHYLKKMGTHDSEIAGIIDTN